MAVDVSVSVILLLPWQWMSVLVSYSCSHGVFCRYQWWCHVVAVTGQYSMAGLLPACAVGAQLLPGSGAVRGGGLWGRSLCCPLCYYWSCGHLCQWVCLFVCGVCVCVCVFDVCVWERVCVFGVCVVCLCVHQCWCLCVLINAGILLCSLVLVCLCVHQCWYVCSSVLVCLFMSTGMFMFISASMCSSVSVCLCVH